MLMEISVNAFCHHFNRMVYFNSKKEPISFEPKTSPNLRLGQFANRATKVVFNSLDDHDKNFIIKYLNTINPRYRFVRAKKSDNTKMDKNVTIKIIDTRFNTCKNFKYFKNWSFDYLMKYENGKLMHTTIEETLPTLDI